MRAFLAWSRGYAIVCLSVIVWCQAAYAVEYRKVAMTGDIVPDTNGAIATKSLLL
jgi:hypothetical protein